MKTRAQSAWTTRMVQQWMGTMLGCVLCVGSVTAVRATQVGLLPGHPTAQPAVHHSVSRMMSISSVC